MKILMVSHYFGSHRGGVEIVAERMFRELAAKGQDVVWIAGNASPPPTPVGNSRAIPLRIFSIVGRKLGIPFPIPTIASLLEVRKEIRKTDVLIIHDCLYLTNIAAFVLARRRAMGTI